MIEVTVASLVSAKAAEELAKLRLLRHVVAASDSGMSQYEIADALGVTQPVVHRMLKRARLDPEATARSPREVALQYAVNEIGRAQTLTELGDRDYTYGRAADPGSPTEDAYLPGTWNDVTHAAYSTLITNEDYPRDHIAGRTAPATHHDLTTATCGTRKPANSTFCPCLAGYSTPQANGSPMPTTPPGRAAASAAVGSAGRSW